MERRPRRPRCRRRGVGRRPRRPRRREPRRRWCTRRRRRCGCRCCACSPRGTCSSRTCRGSGRPCSRRRSPGRSTCSFSRLQFTPDLLPSDVTGVNVYDQQERRVPLPAGPGVRQRAARRRDQPRLAEDAVGAARGDAGGAGHGRRRDVRARAPVSRDRDPEPGRVRGHLPAPGGAARPLRDADGDRLPAARGGGADARRADGRAAARRARAGRGPRRAARRDRGRARVFVEESVNRYVVALLRHTRANRSWRSVRARGRESRSCGSRRRAPSSSGGTSSTPEDIRAMARARARHRLLLAPEARSAGLDRRGRRARGARRHARTGVRRHEAPGPIATRARRPRGLVALRLDAARGASALGLLLAAGCLRAALGARRAARSRSSASSARRARSRATTSRIDGRGCGTGAWLLGGSIAVRSAVGALGSAERRVAGRGRVVLAAPCRAAGTCSGRSTSRSRTRSGSSGSSTAVDGRRRARAAAHPRADAVFSAHGLA